MAYNIAPAKQDTLVSGTNIKTVNSNSLLGSGDVAVQEVLVSGTNLKSVNSTSLLGAGDLAVQEVLVSGTNLKSINSNSLLGSGDLAVADVTLSNLTSPTAINQSLLFATDNANTIGTDGGNRPASIHAADHITAPTVRARDNITGAGQHDITVRAGNGTTGNKDGGDLTLAGGTPSGSGAAGNIFVKTNNISRMQVTASGVVTVNGQLDFNDSLVVNSLHAQTGVANVITVTTSNYYVGVTSAAAAKTVNLPAAASAGQGFSLTIKDEGGSAATNNITVDADGSETIDGQLTALIGANYGSLNLICDGSNWFIS